MQRKEEKISDTKSFSRTRRFTKTRRVISLGLIVLVMEAPHPSLSTKLLRFRNGGGNAAAFPRRWTHSVQPANGAGTKTPVQRSQANEQAAQLCFECTLLRFKRWNTACARGSAQTAITRVRCNRSETVDRRYHGCLNVFLDERGEKRSVVERAEHEIFDRAPTIGLIWPITPIDELLHYEPRVVYDGT